MNKKEWLIYSVIAILFLSVLVSASINAPSAWNRGAKMYLNYTDMMNETGVRNGSFGNITFIEFKLNATQPAISLTNTSLLYYNQTSETMKVSMNGSRYKTIMNNESFGDSPNISVKQYSNNGTIRFEYTGTIGDIYPTNATLLLPTSDYSNSNLIYDSDTSTCAVTDIGIAKRMYIDTQTIRNYEILSTMTYNSQGGGSNWVGYVNLSTSRDNITYTKLYDFGGTVNSANITYNILNKSLPFRYFRYIRIATYDDASAVGNPSLWLCELAAVKLS